MSSQIYPEHSVFPIVFSFFILLKHVKAIWCEQVFCDGQVIWLDKGCEHMSWHICPEHSAFPMLFSTLFILLENVKAIWCEPLFLLWASDLIRQRMRTCLNRFIQSTQLFQFCLACFILLKHVKAIWCEHVFLLWASDVIRQRVRKHVLTYLFHSTQLFQFGLAFFI